MSKGKKSGKRFARFFFAEKKNGAKCQSEGVGTDTPLWICCPPGQQHLRVSRLFLLTEYQQAKNLNLNGGETGQRVRSPDMPDNNTCWYVCPQQTLDNASIMYMDMQKFCACLLENMAPLLDTSIDDMYNGKQHLNVFIVQESWTETRRK